MKKNSVSKLALAVSIGFMIATSPSLGAGLSRAEVKEQYALAEALRLGSNGSHDPTRAFEILSGLAETGDARAQSKLAYYHLRGVGTNSDLSEALIQYERAIDLGHDRSRVSYAKALIKAGRAEDALRQLETAIELEIPNALLTYAEAHFDEKLGDASRIEEGRTLIAKLASGGDISAVQSVLFRIAKGHRFAADTDQLLVEALRVASDLENRLSGRSAEAALLYISSRRARADIPKRQELVAHPKIRSVIRIQEQLNLARDVTPARFWTEAEEIVGNAAKADYARALVLTARIDRNAYVHILQKELQALGYRPGRASGYLTRSTIRATNKFCREVGIWDACLYGPIKSISIKAIAAALAERRASLVVAATN